MQDDAKTAQTDAEVIEKLPLAVGPEVATSESMIPNANVACWMTASPVQIGPHEPISRAHRLFNEHGIRHLPVIEDERLVGLVCERDVQVAELFGGKQTMPVEIVMARSPYVVAKATPVAEVARELSERREDAAVVMEGDRVTGVFTTADALRALAACAS